MKLRTIIMTGVIAGVASAFSDTSPFLLFSTAQLASHSSHLASSDDLATARSVEDHLATILHDCPTSNFVVVKQPEMSTADFEGDALPHLRRRMVGADAAVKSTRSVRSVVGELGATHVAEDLARLCGAEIMALDGQMLPLSKVGAQVITIDLPALPQSEPHRGATLSKHDSYLNAVLESLPSSDVTVIYWTTPRGAMDEKAAWSNKEQAQLYEMEDGFPSRIDSNHFKRDVTAYPRAENGSNLDSDLALFEKYQFFSSGIFMSLSVSLVLLAILYVAISAVAGLEVSYYAFSKEYNPASQKKQ